MAIAATAGTHTGWLRTNNEDAFLSDDDSNLFVVCDGMGGHEGGEIASLLAIAALRSHLERLGMLGRAGADAGEAGQALARAIRAANERVQLESRRRALATHMGTTVVAVLVLEEEVVVASVGDSRAYLVRADGSSRRLTRDHTVAQIYAEMGLIRPEEVHRHPLRNVLVRSVGSPESCDPDVAVVRWHPGDRLLLCSDGLTDMVSEGELLEVTRATADLEAARQALIQLALDAGGRDNVTVLLLERQSSGAKSAPARRP